MIIESSRHPWQNFEVGLVTIQFETAFITGAAEGDNLFDAVFVVDANGLPCIPGESLAGVLRHALAGNNNPATDKLCCEVFGFQQKNEGRSSRLRISFGHVHGQHNRPVAFRGADMDPVLAFLAAGAGRDHVRIGPHGAAYERGKFDELIVPAGARFTFELCLARNDHIDLARLVSVLGRSEIRIGAKSRRGLGRISLHGVRSAIFDLARAEDVERLSKVPVAIEKMVDCDILKPVKVHGFARDGDSRWVEGSISLRPIGTWMVGGGIPTEAEPPRSKDSPWDRVPLTERRIEWQRQGGVELGKVVEPQNARPLVPGSSIKGSLRHRTAFHIRRIKGSWHRAGTRMDVVPTDEEKALFGEVRSGSEGSPGRVYIADVQLPQAVDYVPIQHVSLDRFTQGPMDHLLYDEVALGDCALNLNVSVRVDERLPDVSREAFQSAIDDLCSGRLAIGAGRGHGRFIGHVSWSDEGKWIGGRA